MLSCEVITDSFFSTSIGGTKVSFFIFSIVEGVKTEFIHRGSPTDNMLVKTWNSHCILTRKGLCKESNGCPGVPVLIKKGFPWTFQNKVTQRFSLSSNDHTATLFNP